MNKNFPEKFIIDSQNKKHPNPAILIPCNFSFCNDDNKIKLVEEWYKKFNEIGVYLFLSYSTDGKYATDTREHTDITEEFFDKVLALCSKYD